MKKTSIGGQALIEGVMMLGPHISAMAVRKPDGDILVETNERAPAKWYSKVPLLRGVLNMISSLSFGYKCLMKSAEISGFSELEEPGKFEKWVDKHLGDKAVWIFNILVTVLALALSLGLFMFLPAAITRGINSLITLPNAAMSLIEGCIKIAVFVLYLFIVTRMPDIQRVFAYHGAEHKSIACYEAGEELTPENAKKYTRFHPRCGTSLMLIVLIVSILVFSVVTWGNLWVRVALKVVLLPVVVGISYELVRFAGRHDDSKIVRVLIAPGLWLQRLTTFEPDLTQLEVAIAALTPCIPKNENDDNY